MPQLCVNVGSVNPVQHEVHGEGCRHLPVRDKRRIYPRDPLKDSVMKSARDKLNIRGCSALNCSRGRKHVLASISLCKHCLVVKRGVVHIIRQTTRRATSSPPSSRVTRIAKL